MFSPVFVPLCSLLRWFGGGDPNILDDAQTEGMRISATGMAVLSTGAIALTASMITARTFLRASWPVALLAGMFWAAVIICFDRWMLLSIRRQPRTWQTLLSATPRLALAVCAGFVFSKPILMLMFNHEVTFHAKVSHHQSARADQGRIDSFYKPRIAALTIQEGSIQKHLAIGDAATYLEKDPVYRADVHRANQLQAQATNAQSAAICELAGTCGTHHAGAGDVYDAKQSRARTLASETARARAAVTARAKLLGKEERGPITQGQEAERVNLRQVEERLSELRGQESSADQQLRREARQPIGLADRLAALQAVEDSNFETFSWALAVDLLILLADAGPVINKTLLLLGPQGAYERAQEEQEQTQERLAAARHQGEFEAAKISANEEVAQAELHNQLWNTELEELMPMVVRTQADVIRMTIEDWSEGELEEAKARRRKAQAYTEAMRAAREHSSQVRGGLEHWERGTSRPLGATRRHWWR